MKNYKTGKYLFFDLLVYIHKTLDIETTGIRSMEKDIYLYDILIKNFFIEINDENNIDVIIEKILNLCGFLWLMQPFYDGNTRTLIIFMNSILKEFNYKINLNYPFGQIIPLFYEENERCNHNDIERAKKMIINN